MADKYASLYDTAVKYEIQASCREPLHIGSGDGRYGEVLVHPATGEPFIQASGIAGAFRSWFEGNGDLACEIFGSTSQEDGQSKIRFQDGYFSETAIYTELRPRVKIDPVTGTVQGNTLKSGRVSGQKFQMESVASGSRFSFAIYLFEKDTPYEEAVEESLAAFHAGEIQLGGKKSSGCGCGELLSVKKSVYSMRDPQDRRLWAAEEKEGTEIAPALIERGRSRDGRLHFVLTGRTEGALLVKAVSVREYGAGVPDDVNMQNRKDEFIVPASSLKGALRSQIEKIAAYRGLKNGVIEALFGAAYDKESKGMVGAARFFDCVVGDKAENAKTPVQMRIHIDKLTGGVFQQQLFSQRPVCGQVEIRVDLETEEGAGLVLMALRDLGMGLFPLGSGSGIGRGYLAGSSLRVELGGKRLAEIDLNAGEILSGRDVIDGYMKDLAGLC